VAARKTAVNHGVSFPRQFGAVRYRANKVELSIGLSVGIKRTAFTRASAMASVVNANATAKNPALLEAINGGTFPAFADGGFVGTPPSVAPVHVGNTVTQNVSVQVQGSAGTPQQNQDLADRVAKSLDQHAQALFARELRRQMRPGGMLSGVRQ
jgi:hypothetical protein